MPDKEYDILRKNYTYLLETITYPDPVINMLFQEGVLDSDERKEIEQTSESKPKVKTLLDILMARCRGAYPMFIKCLKQSIYLSVAEKLESEGPTTIQEEKLEITGNGASVIQNDILPKYNFHKNKTQPSLYITKSKVLKLVNVLPYEISFNYL
ncbi:hypothetical protein SNE40_003487 [Patella caerulea]|uniref:CARD domain-containing protein n=1 Tax=Patella caerulea TaxID=87958 RepID=A0AAN8Q0A9_PATCE